MFAILTFLGINLDELIKDYVRETYTEYNISRIRKIKSKKRKRKGLK